MKPNDSIFSVLWADALTNDNRDAYISDWTLSSVWGNEPPAMDELVTYTGKVWDAAHMTVKQIRTAAGYTQAAFAKHFCVNQRTVENWELRDCCPAYVRLLLARACNVIDI